MLLASVIGLVLGWSEPNLYFSAQFFVSAALLIIMSDSIQSSWCGIPCRSFAINQTAEEATYNEHAKYENRNINQLLGVWGKLSLVSGILFAITLIAG